MESVSYLAIFITGLTTGALSCASVQGALLASVIANEKKFEQESGLATAPVKKSSHKLKITKSDLLPVGMFLLVKLITYTAFGFLLGALGSVITLNQTMKLGLQVFTAFFLIATACNLLNVHPIFRFVAFQPPAFIRRRIKNTTKSSSLFAPAMLGFFALFLPCGVTQAMEVLAITSGNAVTGALIMFFFVLGTAPVFALIGIVTTKLSDVWTQRFNVLAGVALIFMGIYALNGVLVAMDSPIAPTTLLNITLPGAKLEQALLPNVGSADTKQAQKVTIAVKNNGYSPNHISVKQNIPVELTLTSDNAYSCALDFIFKEYNLQARLNPTDSQILSFTPTTKGTFTFSCSMGMYSGTMEVI